jgi:TonB family protein
MKKLLPVFVIFLFAFCAFGQNANVVQAGGDQPLKIIKKPRAAPGYCSQGEAVARVRATFDRSGKVTVAEVTLPSGCREFDERAVKAAKRIQFEPAMKDGQPVTVSKLVEYVYRRY